MFAPSQASGVVINTDGVVEPIGVVGVHQKAAIKENALQAPPENTGMKANDSSVSLSYLLLPPSDPAGCLANCVGVSLTVQKHIDSMREKCLIGRPHAVTYLLGRWRSSGGTRPGVLDCL